MQWQRPMSSCETGRPSVSDRPRNETSRRSLQFLNALSPQSRYFRFFGVPTLDTARVRLLTAGHNRGATSLVAESGGRIVAFAGFHRDPNSTDRAEVAFAVSDALQGHGIGTRLLERLASIAREHGINTFDAYVLGDNRRMLDVFGASGFGVTTTVDCGVCHVVLSLSVTSGFSDKAAARSRTAATASMKAFFEPRVVAVVGANRERGKIGSEILHNLSAGGFTGTIVPVHPTARAIGGFTAYPRVIDIPGPVDLAMVVVPAVAGAGGRRRLHQQARSGDLRHQRRVQRMRRRRARARSGSCWTGFGRRAAA